VTENSVSLVKTVCNLGYTENMFDVTVGSKNHRYYTNGILSHNTQTTAAFILHYVLFNKNKTVAILANKGATAREIISRIKQSFEELPTWMQIGVKEWNKGSIEFENGSSVIAAATSGSAIRGKSISLLYLDEFAFLHPNMAMEFFESVYPTISSGKETKILISSTPKGFNHFYKMYNDAIQGKSEFTGYEIKWNDIPGRDDAWKEKTISTVGMQSWLQEYCGEFQGSSYTLVSGTKIGSLASKDPIFKDGNFRVYEKPIEKRNYVITIDTSRGQHHDFHAFSVIDITALPYKQVATFKDNALSPLEYPTLIYNVAKMYNSAYCLIEINDNGQQVADALFYDFEYENIYFTKNEKVTEGLGYPGVRTTKKVKSIGCSVMKDLIEKDMLEINDLSTINELAGFSKKGASYAAEDTSVNDDLCTTLFLFGWLTKEPIFSELNNVNIRKKISEQYEEYVTENMTPFGIIDNGIDAYSLSSDTPVPKYGSEEMEFLHSLLGIQPTSMD
jgi:hypothetical protein